MPSPVSRHQQLFRLLLLALPVIVIAGVGMIHQPAPFYDDTCIDSNNGLVICASSDMMRTTRTGHHRAVHPRYNLAAPKNALTWQAARNETLAFQLMLRRRDRTAPESVQITLADSPIHAAVFAAHYHAVDNAGYSWGPSTEVLPYPASYPDALVPRQQVCGDSEVELFDQLQLPSPGRNQSVWVDLYVPGSLPTGPHQQDIMITSGEGASATSTTLTVTLDVIDASLPHKPSIDAIGEVYRAYNLEGAGYDSASPMWRTISQCYQQLAHQHRMVFIERTPEAPSTPTEWATYAQAFGPALTGELFSAEAGYRGTGMDTPVSIWRTPWPQDYDITVEQSLTPAQLSQYAAMAETWANVVAEQAWQQTRYFAYVFDEVDGPSDVAETDPDRREYIKRVHKDMQQVQQAIDRGIRAANDPAQPVDLVWTSHSDPTVWVDDPETTLVDRVRLWAPNAHAANTDFLRHRIDRGERAWFYHSGHPAVGGHAINLPGTDMRSWGVIGARYGIQGQLMWAVNLGNDAAPFADPSYKPDDDRVGNGVMVYPGNQLPNIGYTAAPGPVPSMRLKTWRRGLQDAELYFLAHERYPEAATALLHNIMPRALQEAVAHGDSTPAWPADEAQWIQWRDDLLSLLADSDNDQ